MNISSQNPMCFRPRVFVAVHRARGRCTNCLQSDVGFHHGLYGRHEGKPQWNQLHRKLLDAGSKPRD